jgi:hypothetical protein
MSGVRGVVMPFCVFGVQVRTVFSLFVLFAVSKSILVKNGKAKYFSLFPRIPIQTLTQPVKDPFRFGDIR